MKVIPATLRVVAWVNHRLGGPVTSPLGSTKWIGVTIAIPPAHHRHNRWKTRNYVERFDIVPRGTA
jgi:hypothetical protein